MIRRSIGIGIAALLMSLAIHSFGIGVTFTLDAPRERPENVEEAIALSENFDDLADFQAEPVSPEPLEPVEPPQQEEEPEPETQKPVEPTSEALVASANPQQTPSPDTGLSPSVEPGVNSPVTLGEGSVPEPDVSTPSGGTGTEASDAKLTSPVGVDTESNPVLGEPDILVDSEIADPVDIVDADQLEAPEPDRAPTPSLDFIAALPTEPVTNEADDALPASGPASDDTDDGTPLATSLRPRLRPSDLSKRGTTNSSNFRDALRAPSQLIESPLTAYARDGTNLFAGQRGGQQSGNEGFGGGRGPGNSDVTNYTGLVLVHLNRTPPVPVSSKGWARVVFRIEPDGTLSSVDIIDGSGSDEIDRAAKLQISQAVPFPLPPDGESKLLNFVYNIE